MKNTIYLLLLLLFGSSLTYAQTSSVEDKMIPPFFLENEKRLSGNPLATYSLMLEKEAQYLESHFSGIYVEQKLNMEEFMGLPTAGLIAMGQGQLKRNFGGVLDSIPKRFSPKPALTCIEEVAIDRQLIIWGEEHHLPQSRSLYTAMLKKLWEQGFRYLAAETFSKKVEKEEYISPTSGYYLQDPIYADAVKFAKEIGYKLVSYDNNSDERDKKQAENIYTEIFKKDPKAKVLVIAGRGHISESVQSGNWEPMGYWLKKLTGIDPFTIYAPTMSDRLTENEMHPFYRYAIKNELIKEITIFQDTLNKDYLGSDAFDAYAFFPKVELINGRPDWMYNVLNRQAFEIPKTFLREDSKVLVQAHNFKEPDHAIPVDQLLVFTNTEKVFLALPKGKFRIRSINANGEVLSKKNIIVK